ncbi:MAG: YciI family protein [Intrasporangium sp.]|uniref:YciI family protein n=1 Tax=Intrasporangium sp. TaxID=1925024 RepID=UPI002647C775|nr:YciI family protein [Intrasporangium sp.]MDN5795650.1 YciI family protein [Intrasporangium sp.]
MKTYLITLYAPPGPPPAEVDLAAVMAELEKVNSDIRAAGGWVFAGGLGDLAAATTVRTPRDGSAQLLTDGPFLEAKEHMGGLSIVQAEDYDVALGWAKRIGAATGLAVEIRPFVDEDDPGRQPEH